MSPLNLFPNSAEENFIGSSSSRFAFKISLILNGFTRLVKNMRGLYGYNSSSVELGLEQAGQTGPL